MSWQDWLTVRVLAGTMDGAAASGGRRRFEFDDGKSSKFWEIETEGNNFTTCWGKIGTAGQSKTLSFASAEQAGKEAEKLIAEKTKKGYVEIDT